jgi:hypothetical protein
MRTGEAGVSGSVPESVTVHGLTWTGALVGLLNVLVGGALVALIRSWPTLKKIANDREETQSNRYGARITALEEKAERAMSAATRAQMQMTYVTAALGMVSAELERKDPGNPVIKSARDLVAQATHEEPPFGEMVRKLGAERGVGE